MSYVRPCPRCGDARPAEEFFCEGKFHDQACGWPLIDVLPVPEAVARTEPAAKPAEASAAEPTAGAASGRCRNGHPMDAGEFMCMVCGEPAAVEPIDSTPVEWANTPGEKPPPRVVHGWTLGTELGVISGESDLFLATKESADAIGVHETAVFKHYRRGIEPEASLYPALRALDPDHGLRLLDAGRSEDRAFEVWE